MLEKLSTTLKTTLQKFAGAIFIDERIIDELIRDLQRALLQADVDVKIVFEFTKKIKELARKEPTSGLTKREQIIKIVYNQLVELLGGNSRNKIEIIDKPFKIMLVGLYGSGKTTTAGKLAKYYSKRGFKVGIVGLDTYRPAAMEQIEQIGMQINLQTYTNKNEKNPVKIWKSFSEEFSIYDIIIIDTSGRDAMSIDLIQEIKNLYDAIKPNENLLVISADIGQPARTQAEKFHEACKITGIITTKMDSTAKAGSTLTACAVTNSPVLFIGTGEKIEDIEQFNPTGFVSRLLGMGDLEALLEKAQATITEKEAKEIAERFLEGNFTLIDLYEQMNAMKKLGPLSKIVELIPGLSTNIPKDIIEVQQERLEQWRYAMDSMTKEELSNDVELDSNRISRISNGSGVPEKEIREMIKKYKLSKKVVKSFNDERKIEKLIKKFGGNINFSSKDKI